MKRNALFLVLTLGTLYFWRRELLTLWAEMDSKTWTRFDYLFEKYGRQYGVGPDVLKAICLNESILGTVPSVAHGLKYPHDIEGSKSSDGLSWGIMQVTIKTARDLDASATEEKLNNAEYSVKLAAQLIASDMRQFDKNSPRFVELYVKAYNQGAPLTKKRDLLGQEPLKPKVQEYWDRFLRNLQKVQEG